MGIASAVIAALLGGAFAFAQYKLTNRIDELREEERKQGQVSSQTPIKPKLSHNHPTPAYIRDTIDKIAAVIPSNRC